MNNWLKKINFLLVSFFLLFSFVFLIASPAYALFGFLKQAVKPKSEKVVPYQVNGELETNELIPAIKIGLQKQYPHLAGKIFKKKEPTKKKIHLNVYKGGVVSGQGEAGDIDVSWWTTTEYGLLIDVNLIDRYTFSFNGQADSQDLSGRVEIVYKTLIGDKRTYNHSREWSAKREGNQVKGTIYDFPINGGEKFNFFFSGTVDNTPPWGDPSEENLEADVKQSKDYPAEWDENTKKAYDYFVDQYLPEYTANQEGGYQEAKRRAETLTEIIGEKNVDWIVEFAKWGRCGDYALHVRKKLEEKGMRALLITSAHRYLPLFPEYTHGAVVIPPDSYYQKAREYIEGEGQNDYQLAHQALARAKSEQNQKAIDRWEEMIRNLESPRLEEIYPEFYLSKPLKTLPEEWEKQPVLDGYKKTVITLEEWVDKYENIPIAKFFSNEFAIGHNE